MVLILSNVVRVLNSRGVAFITYTNEANAQFAKEAMAHQSLDQSEILNVRWATVDPNPLAQKREARKIEEQAAEAVRRALPADFVAEIEGRDPEARKRKKIEGGFGLQGYEAPDEVWFARSRAIEMGNGVGQIEAGEERYLVEDAPPAERNGGILSGSALAALKGYTSQPSGVKFASTAPAAAQAGPLVAYGSDDDSG